MDLHAELEDALNGSERCKRVNYLRNDVYVQYNGWALDRNGMESSSGTITREESRSVVHHSLDALRSEFASAVAGQPVIGKTRGVHGVCFTDASSSKRCCVVCGLQV